MITNEIYFFENQSSVSTSDFLYNVNDGTLILQVDGDVSNLELSVLGNTDLVDDDFVTLKTINASDYSMCDKITSTGIYWIDINGIRKIKLNLSKITGSVNVKAITKRGLTTDLVARAMAANASGGGSYTLPVASASTLGGIKVGENLTITEDGILSATGGGSRKINIVEVQGQTIDLADYEEPTLIHQTMPNTYVKYNKKYVLVNNKNLTFADNLTRALIYWSGTNFLKSATTDSPALFIVLNNAPTRIEENSYANTGFSTIKFSLSSNGRLYGELQNNNLMFKNNAETISGEKTFITLPKSSINPTSIDQFTRKGYVDSLPTTYAGYDATKTQVLKNINGTLTWVNE